METQFRIAATTYLGLTWYEPQVRRWNGWRRLNLHTPQNFKTELGAQQFIDMYVLRANARKMKKAKSKYVTEIIAVQSHVI